MFPNSGRAWRISSLARAAKFVVKTTVLSNHKSIANPPLYTTTTIKQDVGIKVNCVAMASNTPLSPGGRQPDFSLPIPPPLLHTRTGSDLGERPLTPGGSENAFVSPVQTPQGSPSKNRLPPGAFDLPDVFSNAMKLFPTMGSPNKGSKQQSPTSPNKGNLQKPEQGYEEGYMGQDTRAGAPGSPTRKSNKENTPPARPNMQKDTSFMSHAAASRQDPYRTQDAPRPSSPTRQTYAAAPTAEEMEKLQKASVKRLANVTQLCTTFLDLAS